jgi:hypothetical protein
VVPDHLLLLELHVLDVLLVLLLLVGELVEGELGLGQLLLEVVDEGGVMLLLILQALGVLLLPLAGVEPRAGELVGIAARCRGT